jgi:hypothetical protein
MDMSPPIETTEDVNIKLQGPQSDRERSTGQTAASGAPQAQFANEKRQEMELVFKKLRESQLSYIDKIPEMGLDTLQIHDLIFALPRDLTPPTSIRIDKDMINYKWHTLRTSEVQKVTSGHSTARIYLSLYFVGLKAINSGLRRLLAVFNGLPFVYVENSFIRNNLAPSGDKEEKRNMACSLVNISVRTEPQAPNVLVAELTLLWFNYRPFATNFWFRKSWNSTLEAPRSTQALYNREIIAATDGPRIPSEDDMSIAQPLEKGDQTAAFSPPAVLPQESDPLRHLVKSREGEIMKSMSNRIEIGFRRYMSVGGLHSGTISSGKINKKILRDVSSTYVGMNRMVLLKLNPEAAEQFEQLAEQFAKRFSKPGISRRLHIGSCYRTREMQRQLQKSKPDVASKGYSWHEVGLAVDIGTYGRTREEYVWLIQRASDLGFKNLGVTEQYSPHFTDGGRWDDGKDPSATIIKPPAGTINHKGRLKNWETWHFDYKPTQDREKKRYGSTQITIKTLRGMIHYTSVGLGAKEIVSETGEETSLDKVRQKETQAETEMAKRLDAYFLDGWEVDPFGSDPVRILLYKPYKFTIEDDDKALIPQGIAFAKSNIIAEIPILSHEFSTQQYMGSTDLDASISFIAKGEGKLKALQHVIELIQNNSRIAKGVRDAAVIDIDNSILNFGGMDQAIVDKIDAMSIPQMPGCYQINLSLTQARRKEKDDLNQERFLKLDAWKEATRWVIGNMFEMRGDIIKDIKYIANWETLNELAGESKDNDLDMYQDLEDITQEDIAHIVPGNPGTDDRQWLIRSLALLNDGTRRYAYNAANIKTDKTRSNKYPGYTITYLKEGDLYETPIAEILREYASIIATIVSGPFPRELLFRLGLEGLANVIEDSYGEAVPEYVQAIFNQSDVLEKRAKAQLSGSQWAKASKTVKDPWSATGLHGNAEGSFDFAFKHYKNRLHHLWVRIYNEGLYLHPVFAGLYSQMYEIFEQFRRGTECYPDLNLPPNVLTGKSLDTPPDYWFWNTSIDGNLLFYDKKAASTAAAEHMANAYASMEKLHSEEWQNNYISPNKNEITKRTTGPDGDIRARFAALAADESGIGALGVFNIKGDVINQTFELLTGHSPPELNGQTIQMGGNNEGAQIKPDEALESEHIVSGYSGRLIDMLDKSMQNFDAEIYRLARAYPTFKVYFMEEDLSDSGRLGIRNFDDFYSYSAIKDIRIVRSRKIPADLCVISITNIHGELDTLAYSSNDESSSARAVEKFDPLNVNTDQENPFTKLVVLEGSKIQVRLGYSNAPDELDTVFTGQVVEVGVSPISPDIIQLVCQSYGVELVAKLKTGGEYDTTAELLSSLICSEECFHFGRYSRSGVFDPAEVRSAANGGSRAGFMGTNKAIDLFKESLLKEKNFRNKPQDDNIFTPHFGEYETWGHKIQDRLDVVGLGQGGVVSALTKTKNDRAYYPWQTTIWDIFKEMELRHPGHIALPVPYGDRYTMFFGHPSHKYWSRPLSEIERGGWGFVESFVQSLQDKVTVHASIANLLAGGQVSLPRKLLDNPALKQKMNTIMQATPGTTTNLHGEETSFSAAYQQFNEYMKWLIKGRAERYKPFRQYHFLSSENNIFANNIKASAHGTFNGVELTYLDDAVEKQEVHTEAQAQRQVLQAIDYKGAQLKMKADDNIEEKDTRMMQALYTSCFDSYFARRYAVGLLMRSLRDVYKGTIVITGNPKIKPYDVCVLFDTYRDIYGPVEVEQVTHIMSQETGFVTEIKPDMIITHNALTTQCTMDAMVQSLSQLYGKVADEVGDSGASIVATGAGTIAAGATLGTGMLAGGVGFGLLAFGGYKLIEWSQERQPIVITPIMNGIKPLIAGLDGYKRDDLWRSIEGRWSKFTDDIDEGWRDWWERSPVSSWWHETMSDIYQPSHE